MHTALARLAPLTLLALAAAAQSQTIPAPDVPDPIKAPPGERVVLRTQASGVQIYVCGHAADGAPQWTLKGPEAVLHDEAGHLVGHHSAGPTWTYKDGSAVSGKAVAHVDALDPNAIPWLRVEVTSHVGKGLFEHVTTVQRIRTRGGEPPQAASCTPANQYEESRVPYSADYYFYAPEPAAAP
jgi:Protein of unknown function (DUF3455)